MTDNSNSTQSVSIAIGPSMYGRFEDLPNSTSHVLAEFVDNALQSFRDKRDDLLAADANYKLEVSIDIEWNDSNDCRARKLIIRDNASGIDKDKYIVAFQPAKTPEDNTGLNEFGMGLKTAACWLGSSWTVTTKALGENVERTLTFDLDTVINNKLDKLNVVTQNKPIDEHYTVITIWNSTKNVPARKSYNKIVDELASIYRQPLRNNELDIIVCGEKLHFADYDILFAPFSPHQIPQGDPIYWKKEIDFKFGKYSARGFVGLLRDINKDHNGFVLMRRGRVIMGAETGGRYFPKFVGSPGSFRYKRLFGELELDGFEVSFNKNDIQDKENLEALMDVVKGMLHTKDFDLITQADDYRLDHTVKNIKKLVKKHDTAPKNKRVPVVIEARQVIDKTRLGPHSIPVKEPTIGSTQIEIIEQYADNYKINGTQYTLEVVFTTNGSDLFWLDSTKENDNIIKCIINSSHPYFAHFGGPTDSIVAIIKSLAIAKFSTRKFGGNSVAAMMDYFNNFIKQTKV